MKFTESANARSATMNGRIDFAFDAFCTNEKLKFPMPHVVPEILRYRFG